MWCPREKTIMSTPEAVEEILAKLAKDVEAAVHALYRNQAGTSTTKVRTENFVDDARKRIAAFVQGDTTPRASGAHQRFSAVELAAPSTGGAGEWTADDVSAVTKCVMAWLPMGPPTSAAADSRCIAAGRELLPSWGERETARAALRKNSK